MFDVIVVGRSLTGSLCALELRARGLSVALFEYIADGEHLERMAHIPPTLLNDEVVSGERFAECLRARMTEIGVDEGDDWVCEIHPDTEPRVVLFGHERVIAARSVVFAPAGYEVGAPELRASDFYGRGISTDAWSDVTFATTDQASGEARLFFAGKTVAVLGGGLRAAEECLLCVRAGVEKVILLCEQSAPEFGELRHDILSSDKVEVRCGSRIVSLDRDASGQLQALRCVDAIGHEHVLAPAWLFLARGVACDWSAFGGKVVHDASRVVVAGIAAGIPNADRGSLIVDAHRAALAIASLSTARPLVGGSFYDNGVD